MLVKKLIRLLVLFTLFLFLYNCVKPGDVMPTVYAAGMDENSTVTCFWKNGAKTNLNPSSAVNSLYVSGGTVYIGGDSGYWVDGTRHDITDSIGSIDVYDGKVFFCGSYLNGAQVTPCCWIDDIKQSDLECDSDIDHRWYVNAISVSNDVVYCTGGYYDSVTHENIICYWSNGILMSYLAGNYVNNLFISEGVVYAVGEDASGNACFWIDGAKQPSISGMRSGNSICVSSGKVHIAGWDDGGVGSHYAAYWIDGILTTLPESTSEMMDICVYGSSVYISGYNSDTPNKACYWVDGIEYDLPGDLATANAIFVE